jgi:phosphomannomutase
MNNLIISLSGIRGIVGESLTERDIYTAINLFFKTYLKSTQKPLKIIVGRDIKPIGEKLLKRAVTVLCNNDISDIINLGITTLPIMEWAVKHFKASGGIFITASHNPIQWNGIKFISSYEDGASILPASIMQKIKDEWEEIETKQISVSELPPEKSCTDEYNKDVIAKIKKIIDLCSDERGKGNEVFSKLKAKSLRVALDACSNEGLQIPKSFLEALGIKKKNIYSINKGELSECKRRLEPSPLYLAELEETVEKQKLDIGFAFDPDQDRLSVVPLWSEELVPILCAKFLLELQKQSNKKHIKQIAVNLSTSSLWETMAKEYGVEIIRTRVGETNVVEAMRKHNLPFGAEGNGGVILKDINAGRNSTVGMALILAYMVWNNHSIKELEKELPRYFMLKDKIAISLPQEKIQEFLNDKMNIFNEQNKDRIRQINTQDGYKIVFNDNSWTHIRASNTEPIIRIITESKREQTALLITSQLKTLLKS